MSRLLRFLPLALALSACPPPIDVGDGGLDNEILVGPKGGLFVRNGFALDVPAGAVTEEQRIFAVFVDKDIPEVPMRKRISRGLRLLPSSLVPKVPLTVYLPWVADVVPPGVDLGTFDMRRQTTTEAYAALPGARTNTTPFEAVEAKTDKLGLFWVTSPAQANIDRLELEPKEATLRVGETQQFTARVVAPTGDTLDVPVTWRVVPPRVASSDAAGLVTALDPGTATVIIQAGMMTASATLYVQGTTVGPRTFSHQNPFPTGNDLVGGAFAPGGLGTVYAGGNGTVLVEDATGAWTRAFSSPALNLKAVGGTSLTNAVAIGQVNGVGALVEFKGGATAPAVRMFQPTEISDLAHLWFDGTHGMGVGTGNLVVIRRNGAWVTEAHPSFEPLLSVIGDGAGGFTVVGDLGSIYRWDPARKVWDSLYDTRLSVKLEAGALVNVNGEAWAVGGGRLWHFVGTGWVAESLPASPQLLRATSLAAFDSRVFIGGEARLVTGQPLPASKGLVLVRAETAPADGGTEPELSWTPFPLRALQVPRGIFGGGPSSPEGRVVGDLGAVWAWNSATKDFSERSRGFQGDVADLAVTATDTFAAVNECTDLRCATRRGVVMHRGPDGYVPLGTFPSTETVKAIVARTDDEVLVTTPTTVYRWDGAGWTTVPVTGLQGPIMDMTWCGATLWAGGLGSSVYKGNAALLEVASAGFSSAVESLHCPTADELWVAGNGFISNKTPTTNWTRRQSDEITQGPWKAVWSPGPGEGFAFGDARFGVYWDTAELKLQEATGPLSIDVTTAMWGNKIDNLYMTGLSSLPSVFGFMLRFDGINWSLVDSGASRKGTALTGRDTNEVWLGTEGGGVLEAVAP